MVTTSRKSYYIQRKDCLIRQLQSETRLCDVRIMVGKVGGYRDNKKPHVRVRGNAGPLSKHEPCKIGLDHDLLTGQITAAFSVFSRREYY